MAVDMHTHYGEWLSESSALEADSFVKAFTENGVERIVVLPLAGLFSNCRDHRTDNDNLYRFCQVAPRALIPGFSVNPLFGQEVLEEIRRCRTKRGLRLLKLHPWLQGFSVTTKEMDAVAEVCLDLGVTIIFHDGTPPYCTPLQLARLCRDFPGLKVTSRHAGLNDLWRDALLAAQRYENYHVCLCGLSGSQMQVFVDNLPATQICVGSDAAGRDCSDTIWYRWAQWRSVKVSEETRKIIETETPQRLLGITG